MACHFPRYQGCRPYSYPNPKPTCIFAPLLTSHPIPTFLQLDPLLKDEMVTVSQWGPNAVAAIITTYRPDVSGFEAMGAQPQPNTAYSFLFSIDRLADNGTLAV